MAYSFVYAVLKTISEW